MTRAHKDKSARRAAHDVCLVAGDGADRLNAIAERVQWRIAQGATPDQLLILTSTERAAARLRLRLDGPCAARVYSVAAYSERLIAAFAVEAETDPGFEVMDAAEAQAELLEAAEEALDRWFDESPDRAGEALAAVDFADPPREMAAALETMRLSAPEVGPGERERKDAAVFDLVQALRRIAAEPPREETAAIQAWAARTLEQAAEPVSRGHFELLSAIPACEAAGELREILVPAARQAWIAEFYAVQRVRLFDALERIDRRYRERLGERNAFDPVGVVEKAVDLLRSHAEVRSQVNARFVELLVEGLEDLNPLETASIQLMRPRDGVFAAGDPNESVNGFPLSGPEAFYRFRGRRKTLVLRKEVRGRREILRVREAILAGAPGVEVRKRAATRSIEPCVETMVAAGDAEVEARLVAHRIVELAAGARLSGIAVAAASAGALEPVARALDAAGVPRAGAEETRAAVELARLLRVIRNPRDEISLAVTLRSRFVGASPDALLALKQYGNLGIALGWLENVDRERLTVEDLGRLRAFRARLSEWRALAGDVERLSAALTAAGYSARVLARTCGGARTLDALIGRIERLRDREAERPPAEDAEGVRLLTMRGAKGLRFPIVFVMGLGEIGDKEPPALGYSPASGLAVRWIDPATGRPAWDAAYAAFREEWRRECTERESRLLWLAMGLAEERLILSFTAPAGEPRGWVQRIAAALGDPGPGRSCSVERRAAPVRAGAAETPNAAAQPGRHDAVFPVHAVQLFADCPRRYYLEEYAPWHRPARSALHGPAQGWTAHAAAVSALTDKLDGADRVERDLEFALAVEGAVVAGRIDLWFERAGRLTIVAMDAEEVSAEEAGERAAEYSLRLSLEALALERLTGRALHEALVHFTLPGALAPVRLDLEAAVASVRELAAAQSEARFPLKTAERCRACPFYRGPCPAT
jgi:superfamily I DNA/RNA helicase/CRISPR/Cas system-associated exonuclease Cas4 (RecB family)